MTIKQTFNIIILLVFCNAVQAQHNTEDTKLSQKESIPLTYAQQDVIHSSILNENRRVNIFLPEGFHKSSAEHTYPVFLLLDNEFFHMVSGVVKHMSSVERMPETIVVSLVEGPYIPKLFTNGSDFWPKEWKQLPFGGNPDPFTKHLEQELFPYLKEKYRANDFRMLMGLSGTSIYTLHAFAKEPDLFDAHIAIASGDILGMGYKEGENFIDLFEDAIKKSPKRKGYLYAISADSDGSGDSPMIHDNLKELESRLSPYRSDNFQFISKSYPNEGHYDVALPGLQEALNMIFPKKNWFAKYNSIIKEAGNAMENIDTYFQKLSAEYGFEILPRAERWNSGNSLSRIGPNLLRQGNITEAIEVIERWVEYRPKSTAALAELAKAYEANDEFNKAVSVLEKARKMSSEFNTDESNGYQTQINQLKERIAKKGN